MSTTLSKKISRKKRHVRNRKKVLGTADRPRMVVVKSLCNIGIQCVDDSAGKTVFSASTLDKGFPGKELKSRKNTAAVEKLSQYVLEKLKEKGITMVRFDRNGYRYHGKIKLFTDKLREGGIQV